MKIALISTLFILIQSSFAASVDGKIVYKLPNGELVKRDVSIEVPSRGQGEVVLSGKNFEWRTKEFKTVKKYGKTIFMAAFKSQFRQFKSTTVLKGSYLKGTNKIIYYGDVYKKKGHISLQEIVDYKGFKYTGGFKFEYDR